MISQNQIDEIVRLIVNGCKPEKIILFGSYADGSAKADSDLDLAIVKDSDLPRHKRGREIRSVIRSGGKRWAFPMDIVVYTPSEMVQYKNDQYSLIHEIINTGKVLYESKQPTRLAA
jgi:predicted nucleotidyltransferase